MPQSKIFLIILSALFAVLMAVLLIRSLILSRRFLAADYTHHPKQRLRDSFLPSLYLSLAVGCLLIIVVLVEGKATNFKELLSWLYCVSGLVLLFVPVSVVSFYRRSRDMNELWGGPPPAIQWKITPAQQELLAQKRRSGEVFTVPRRVILPAAGVAVLIFIGLTYLFSKVMASPGWHGPAWVEIMVIVGIGIFAFGVFMWVMVLHVARKVREKRTDKPIDRNGPTGPRTG
jgi:hypothetical protein